MLGCLVYFNFFILISPYSFRGEFIGTISTSTIFLKCDYFTITIKDYLMLICGILCIPNIGISCARALYLWNLIVTAWHMKWHFDQGITSRSSSLLRVINRYVFRDLEGLCTFPCQPPWELRPYYRVPPHKLEHSVGFLKPHEV